MNYITESELREAFAQSVPAHYDLPRDARLTPGARQYLLDLHLIPDPSLPDRKNAVPCGNKKPEYMTNLNSRELVCKTHPRIAFRGKLDSLECEILVLLASCSFEWRKPLEDALRLTRMVMSSEVRDVPLPEWLLDGMDEETVHRCSHHPEQFGFSGHILPAPEHGLLAAQLNRLRAMSRETELSAVQAFWNGNKLEHEDIVKALNRLSSYFYVLQLRAVSR